MKSQTTVESPHDTHPGLLDAALARQRRFIGQELHDNVGQQLTGLGLLADGIRRSLVENDDPTGESAEQLVSGLKKALGDLRSLSHVLIDEGFDRIDLAAQLDEMTSRIRLRSDIGCTFHRTGDADVADPEAARNLHRIAQEAIQNALRHAGPDSINVMLCREGDEIRLEIQDDGHGLPPSSRRLRAGAGIKNMWRRAREIGAKLDIRSRADGGTVVTCSLTEGVV